METTLQQPTKYVSVRQRLDTEIYIENQSAFAIATVHNGGDQKQFEETVNLFMAAPEMLAALNAIMAGFVDGSIRFTKKRQSDSDPHHPANILMCAAIAKAEDR